MKFWKIPYWQLLVLPIAFYCLGFMSNKVTKALNHQQMPVMWYGECTDKVKQKTLEPYHTCMTSATHLNLLGDLIDQHDYIESPGDMLIDLSEMTFQPFLYIWILLAIMDLKRT